MAVAAPAAVDRKSVFRQALTALRYAVAGAMTVVVVMTTVYAFRVAARSDDLYILDVVDSHISVQQSRSDDAKLSFTLRVDNPSGRVRFYYTGIQCVINASVSGTDPSTYTVAESFSCPDMVVAPDSVLKINTEVNLHNTDNNSLIHHLFRLTGNLTLNGSLTVGVYSAYNRTSVAARYCCRSVTVGSVNGSSSSISDSDDDNETRLSSWCSTCLTNDEPSYYELSRLGFA